MTKKNLTDREVKSVYNTPSKGDGYRICHLDAGGTLHLVVSRAVDGGINRAWVVRLTLHGQRTKKGIGTWSEIGSIREAKAMAEKFVAALMTTGEDIRKPALVAKTAPAARTPTFGELFPKWIDSVERQKGGVGEIPKRIEGRMMKHVMPALGKLTPEELTPKKAADIINKVPGKKATAKKVLGHLRVFCEWVKTEGYFPQDKLLPTHPDLMRPYIKKRPDDTENRPALMVDDVPRFIRDLTARDSIGYVGSCALLFSVLNNLRRSNVNGDVRAHIPALRWGQIERLEDGAVALTIPRRYMKIKEGRPDFHVPLSTQSLQLLDFVRATGLSDPSDPKALIFPGSHGAELSDAVLNKRIRDLHDKDIKNGGKGFFSDQPEKTEKGEAIYDADGNMVMKVATQHGISRASFKVWQQEKVPQAEAAAEACLDHQKDPYKGAYGRSPLFQARKVLLQAWSDFCFTECRDVFVELLK